MTAITEQELEERMRREKHAAYMRQYYNRNPEAREKKRAADREYAAANRTTAQERAKAHYYANQEKKRLQVAVYQLERKMRAVALLGGKCQSCGYDKNPAALQFHHRDPEEKRFMVSTKVLASPKKFPWDEMIVPELEKCDLLCANCHAEHHSQWTEEMIDEYR